MKRGLKIALTVILGLWAVAATALFLYVFTAFSNCNAAYTALLEEKDALQVKYDEVVEAYTVFVEDPWEDATETFDTIYMESVSNMLSENSILLRCDEQTTITVIPYDGREMSELVDEMSSFAAAVPGALEYGDFSTAIFIFLNENNEVWFGYTFNAGGEATCFVGEDMF